MGTEDQWDEKFLNSIVTNPFEDDASWNGGLFETYGEQLKHVQSVAMQTPNKVWTLIDGDEGMYVVTGYHYVNAFGYLITDLEWEVGVDEDEYKLEEQ